MQESPPPTSCLQYTDSCKLNELEEGPLLIYTLQMLYSLLCVHPPILLFYCYRPSSNNLFVQLRYPACLHTFPPMFHLSFFVIKMHPNIHAFPAYWQHPAS